jgi:hypothetical protein
MGRLPNVIPARPIACVPHASGAHTKPSRERGVPGAPLAMTANLAHGLLVESRVWDAAAARLTTLRDHVRHVRGVGAEEQVLYAYAARVVAAVANERSVRDGSDVKRPRSAVCVDEPTVEPHLTVPKRRARSGPDEALAGILALRSEPDFRINVRRPHDVQFTTRRA